MVVSKMLAPPPRRRRRSPRLALIHSRASANSSLSPMSQSVSRLSTMVTAWLNPAPVPRPLTGRILSCPHAWS